MHCAIPVSMCVFLLVFLATGCGSPAPDFGSEEGRRIANLIDELNEEKVNPKVFVTRFVKSSVPKQAELNRMAGLSYYIVGKPSVQGDTATASVSVHDDKRSEEIGVVEWTFVKEGGNWRIKSIRLP